jgi:CheY-like chemotaxis protein
MRVLLVEDEGLIRLMAAEMLEDLGHQVVEASSLDEALTLAETTDFDVAILDINLGGRRVDPVAEIVSARDIPFLFASGYGDANIPQDFSDRPVLQKPFLLRNLSDSLACLPQKHEARPN